MPLGTKWRVEFETAEPIGDKFIESMILEGVGSGEDREIPIASNIKVTRLRELTEAEYQKHDEEMKKLIGDKRDKNARRSRWGS